MGQVIRYSEAFKIQVVRDLESGRFGSPNEASAAHGIRGSSTVSSWMRKYGREHLLKKVVRVSKKDEPSEIARLKARVRQLESALADSVMDIALERGFFRAVCREKGIDPEVMKKKLELKLSKKPGKPSEDSGE